MRGDKNSNFNYRLTCCYSYALLSIFCTLNILLESMAAQTVIVGSQNRWQLRVGGGGQGGGRPGEKEAGGVREAGEEGAGSRISKVAGSGRKREKLRNVAQYFAIEKMERGGSQKIQGGNRD